MLGDRRPEGGGASHFIFPCVNEAPAHSEAAACGVCVDKDVRTHG